MKLFTYFRSSAAYRVRIGLNLKRIDYEPEPIHLRRKDHEAVEYAAINPQRLVPALLVGPDVLTQSLAILEYLEETHPTPPLLPEDPLDRARVRAIALSIACDIHPIDNLRVLNYLKNPLGQDQEAVDRWYSHWIETGFAALERTLATGGGTGRFCHGDRPTLADVCLVPQVHNARRGNVDLTPYPTIVRIDEACRALPAFAEAAPDRQPDAEG